MSKTPNYNEKIKKILDELQPGERICEMTGEKWIMDEEEIGWYKKFNVPPSPYSPKVRVWLMASYFLVYQWWWNKHAETGEPVLTSIHPASGVRVLPDKEWFARDFSEINLPFDSAQPFFDMWRELQVKVPMTATRNVVEPENSIAQFSRGDKDGYFVASSTSKNCLYLNDCQDAESSVDANGCISVTDCYRVSHSSRLHNCQYVLESFDCMNSSFLFDCRNSEFCFGSANLRNKKYVWLGEQLSKEEWEKRRAEVDLGSYDQLQQQYERFLDMVDNKAVWPPNFNVKTTNSTGDYLIECSGNVRSSFGINAHDNYWCYGIWNARNSAFSCVVPGENDYSSGPVSDTSNSKFSAHVNRCDDVEYSFGCYDCTHCFGCIGLRRKKFCIFNKQYTEDEYWQKVDELKSAMLDRGEYGRPFPAKYSTSYFPESGPVMYLGADLEDWDTMGFKRYPIDSEGAFGEMRMEGKEVKQPDEVPGHINELDDSWIGKPVLDTDIKRPFTFLKPEVAFYKKHNIAPPRKHFTARIGEMMRQTNTGLFEDITCVKCQKSITIAINKTFKNRKVYCQQCYLEYIEQYG